MRSLRRFVALLSAVSLLQLLLLGSATPCGMGNDAASHARMSSVAMAGMTGHSAHAACDASGSGDDCGMPWSGGQCATMATCTPTVASPAASLALPVAPHRTLDLPDPVRISSSPSTAPELPPPRA